jgi:hypothetical protein
MFLGLIISANALEYTIAPITCYGEYRVKVIEHKNIIFNVDSCVNTNISDVWSCQCNEGAETNVKMNIIDEIVNKYDFTVEYYTDENRTEQLKQTWRKVGVTVDSRIPMTDEERNAMLTKLSIIVGIIVAVFLVIGLVGWYIVKKIKEDDDIK